MLGMIRLLCCFLILLPTSTFVVSFEVKLDENSDRVWKSITYEDHRVEGIELECRLMEGGSLAAGRVSWIYKKDNKTTQAKHIATNGAIGNTKDRYSLNGNNLVIKPLLKSDSGTYSCEGSEEDGGEKRTKTAYYYILITYIPSIPTCGFPANHKMAIDTGVQFTCQSDGVPSPTYSWFKDRKRLPTDSSDNPTYDKSLFFYSPETGQLAFEVVTEEDSGEYYCEASNSRGSITCSPFMMTAYEDLAARFASSSKTRRRVIGGTIGAVLTALVLIGIPVVLMARRRGWFRSGKCPKCPAQRRKKSTSIFVTTVDGAKIEESEMLNGCPRSPPKEKKYFGWF